MCSNLCMQAQCGHWCDYKTIGTRVKYENRLSREKPYMALAISLMWFNLEGKKTPKKLRGIPELWINMSCGLSWRRGLWECVPPSCLQQFEPFSVKSHQPQLCEMMMHSWENKHGLEKREKYAWTRTCMYWCARRSKQHNTLERGNNSWRWLSLTISV